VKTSFGLYTNDELQHGIQHSGLDFTLMINGNAGSEERKEPAYNS
jgi:hypothetical protein